MIAHVGDRIAVNRVHPDEGHRAGIVIGVDRADGGPPYRVRWLDDDRVTLIFPGPDARIEAPASTG